MWDSVTQYINALTTHIRIYVQLMQFIKNFNVNHCHVKCIIIITYQKPVKRGSIIPFKKYLL